MLSRGGFELKHILTASGEPCEVIYSVFFKLHTVALSDPLRICFRGLEIECMIMTQDSWRITALLRPSTALHSEVNSSSCAHADLPTTVQYFGMRQASPADRVPDNCGGFERRHKSRIRRPSNRTYSRQSLSHGEVRRFPFGSPTFPPVARQVVVHGRFPEYVRYRNMRDVCTDRRCHQTVITASYTSLRVPVQACLRVRW
ncbi:hypothetical protein MPTK1_4g22410 [Marchantia polymorpha subsp. ruderalis]|uniref:Uncharacterized protein n=2 Tax=Marchantia polymorpha TaxID=3197 RepID=A0AAF6BCM3_MARPO|nr:hypothetical protein MARPO_0020s0011 [Marchantia polymorpha]BBN09757.1 hypothetical protein Mp_4g22410 [Marchantia polymorpha subsp. ruderalis]|eukprot:PTQ44339.1 hypothetical protein MARPO_0020s0011 [Marchantia polymorpha]